MALDIDAILNAVTSHALASGWFERVNTHEPKNAPGNGLTCAIWMDTLAPANSSGQASSSALVVLKVRIYTSMLAEPQDAIDPNVTRACSALITAYAGDLDLGGNVRTVDLRGMAGTPLRAQAGYIPQDNRLYRVLDITLPLIVNDVWDEAA